MPRAKKKATLGRVKQYGACHEWRHISDVVDPNIDFANFSHKDSSRVFLAYKLFYLALNSTISNLGSPKDAVIYIYCMVLLAWFKWSDYVIAPGVFKSGGSFFKLNNVFRLTLEYGYQKTRASSPLESYAIRKRFALIKTILVAFSCLFLFPIDIVASMSLITGGRISPMRCIEIIGSFNLKSNTTKGLLLIQILSYLKLGKNVPSSLKEWLSAIDLDSVDFSSRDAITMLHMKSDELYEAKVEISLLKMENTRLETENQKQKTTFKRIMKLQNKTIASQNVRSKNKSIKEKKRKFSSPKRVRGGVPGDAPSLFPLV